MADSLSGEPLRHFRHELRTPLNHIVGFADILLDDAEEASVPRIKELRTAGMDLLEMLQTALPAEIQTLDRTHLEQAQAALSPVFAQIHGLCAALEAIESNTEAREYLQIIHNAVDQMAATLSHQIKDFA
jgi:signal transduction histidine kinase